MTGSEDQEGLGAMLTVAAEELKHARAISGEAFRLDGDTWEPWLPPKGHPHHGKFAEMRLESIGERYNVQKGLLDELNARTGQDVFVASLSGIRKTDTDEVTSYAIWTKGIPTWLPKTDMLGFIAPDKNTSLLVEWDKAVAVAGDLIMPLDMYPVRYSVTDFPSEAQMRALAGHDVMK